MEKQEGKAMARSNTQPRDLYKQLQTNFHQDSSLSSKLCLWQNMKWTQVVITCITRKAWEQKITLQIYF